MNKKLFSMAVLAGASLFAACSNDAEEFGNGANPQDSEITIALNSGGDVTRAGRPVNSSAAGNQVDHVQLALYKETATNVWTKQTSAFDADILAWAGPADEGVPGYTDRTKSEKIKVKGLEASSKYKIVAYGYDGVGETDACAYTPTDANGVITTSKLPDEGTDGANIEEIFAGEKIFNTDADGKITTFVQVEMNRMVAGMLGYFQNIPVKKLHPATHVLTAVKYVKVYTVAKAETFKFPFSDVFNGIGQTEAKTELLSYDMEALVDANTTGKNYADQVAAAAAGTETFAIDAKTGAVATAANSILKGRFIIPFSASVDQSTITVELQAADNTVLRSWRVKASTQNGGGTTVLADGYKYDVKRNYFYSIGKKLKADTTNPPVDPEDPDKPVDLNQDNDIVLIVNDAWDVIYDMELGD